MVLAFSRGASFSGYSSFSSDSRRFKVTIFGLCYQGFMQKNPAPSSEGAGDKGNQCGVHRSATDYLITFYSPMPMGQRRDLG